MSGLSNVIKGGWNSDGKGGKKESWRNDSRASKGINQVVGSSPIPNFGGRDQPWPLTLTCIDLI
jgi:hypothetical protein